MTNFEDTLSRQRAADARSGYIKELLRAAERIAFFLLTVAFAFTLCSVFGQLVTGAFQ